MFETEIKPFFQDQSRGFSGDPKRWQEAYQEAYTALIAGKVVVIHGQPTRERAIGKTALMNTVWQAEKDVGKRILTAETTKIPYRILHLDGQDVQGHTFFEFLTAIKNLLKTQINKVSADKSANLNTKNSSAIEMLDYLTKLLPEHQLFVAFDEAGVFAADHPNQSEITNMRRELVEFINGSNQHGIAWLLSSPLPLENTLGFEGIKKFAKSISLVNQAWLKHFNYY